MLRRVFLTVITLLFSNASFAAIKVVATTQDLASIASLVGGSYVEATSLTLGTRDPHFAEAKPSMIRQVANADMLLLVGAELEQGWLPPLLQSARNVKVNVGGAGYLDLSQSVELIGKPTGPIDRSHGDVHALGNPHYWLNPINGLKIGQAITARLKLVDEKNAAQYDKLFEQFSTKLRHDMDMWKHELGFMAGKNVIAYHTSFEYLAQAFGFKVVDYVEPKPGIAPSAAHLGRLLNRISTEHIDTLIMEGFYERKSAAFLQGKTNIVVAIVPQSVGARADVTDYFQLFDSIVHALKHPGNV